MHQAAHFVIYNIYLLKTDSMTTLVSFHYYNDTQVNKTISEEPEK